MNFAREDEARYTYRQRKQIRAERMRMLRVVERLDFSGVFPASPVQILDAYIVSDQSSYELFAAFTFQSVAVKPIAELRIRLLYYQNANVPYLKMNYTYSFEQMNLGVRSRPGVVRKWYEPVRESKYIVTGESFGKAALLHVPESYFRRIELELTGVTYRDGSSETFSILARNNSKKFSDLSDEIRYAYSEVNIYQSAEERFPTRVVPQKTDTAWLCCCGQPNVISDEKCMRCGRERDWQFEYIAEPVLEKTAAEIDARAPHHDKSNYSQMKYLETKDDLARKEKEYETALRNVAEEERKRERRNKLIIPKILLYAGVIYLIIFLLTRLL